MDKFNELAQLILEYVDYSQEKFMDKWEKEGKPFEDKIGANGENWISWLEQYDPTKNKKYVNWMIIRYLKDGIKKLEDIPSRLTPLLDTYEKLSRKKKLEPEHRDMNRIKTLSDLYHLINSYKETVGDEELDSRKDIERKLYENGEAELFYDSPNYKIVIPRTEKASCFFGKNTQWCTAATKSENMFDEYNSRGKLYVVLEKKTNKRWQLHFEDKEFMDENDEDIDIIKFFESKPEVKKAFGFGDLIQKKETKETEKTISTYLVTGYERKNGDFFALEKDYHSFNGEPATITTIPPGKHNKDELIIYQWWKNGVLHRDGGEPALVRTDGFKEWYKNGDFIKRTQPGDMKEDKLKQLADILILEADYGGEGKIYKGFTKYHRIPTTSAVRDFCDKLEGVLMEKGIYPSDYLPDQLAAEAIALLPRVPKTLKKHTGYELLSLDGDILMSDAEEGAVRLSDGNYLIFYFEDSEVQYRKFGSSDGGL